MVFKSIEELKAHLLKQIETAVGAAGELAYDKADEKLANFYAEYEPDYYKRTHQLRDNTLSFSPIIRTNNGASVKVGYTDSHVHYDRGYTSLTVWNSMMGDYPHGGWEPAGGRPIYNEFLSDMYELGYADYALRRGMEHAGIPAKRG